MIILIHGEDTTLSRNYYFDLKQKSPDSLLFDGATITLTDLQQALSGDDLFGTKKDIFIDNLFSKRKSPKEVEAFAAVLSDSSSNITVWESKELTPKQAGLLKNATVKLFKIPATIFAFLDALKPHNGKQLMQLFHTTLQDKDAEFVLVMLQRQVRILLAIYEVSENVISEVARIAPWQKGKLEKQAKLFTTEELLALHEKLFYLELNMKTGGLTMPLADSIDMLLLSV